MLIRVGPTIVNRMGSKGFFMSLKILNDLYLSGND